MDDADKVARAWRKAWEEADELVDVPEVCHGCSMPALGGGRDEDGPLCGACSDMLEEEWTRHANAALREIAGLVGVDYPCDPSEVVRGVGEVARAVHTWRRAREIGGIGAPEGGTGEVEDATLSADLLARVVAFVEERARPDTHYGSMIPDDPRDFSPDPECSTEEERAAHRAACEAWDRGERPENPPTHLVADLTPADPLPEGAVSALVPQAGGRAHVHLQPFGLGTSTFRDLEAEQLLADLRAAAGQ